MSKVTVQTNQTLLDLALQYGGGIESVIDMAVQNELSITDDITPGNELIVGAITNQRIVAELAKKAIKPATAKSAVIDPDTGEPVEILSGIGYMAIEIDFIVS